MADPFFVYRPLLDLIGFTEGTDKGRGYNETLAYGAYTGGDVDLVSMTLNQIDALQTKMLKHPKNKLRSSALGRYQIIRTTLRTLRQLMGLTGAELFDRDCQDRMACFLLGQRGVDKYLAGRLKEDTLLFNLAMEWASLPTPAGKGFYGGQHAAVQPARVRQALAEVKRRHAAGQPGPKEVVPEAVEEKVKEKTSFWQKVISFFTGGGGIGAMFYGVDWQTLALILGAGLVAALLVLLLRRQLINAVGDIRDAVRGDA